MQPDASEVVEQKKLALKRGVPEGVVPEIRLRGTMRDCGRQLGGLWRDPIIERRVTTSKLPWWAQSESPLARLVDSVAPCLRELMRAIQQGAGLKGNEYWDDAGSCAPAGMRPEELMGGCTSFSVAPGATLDGAPISGQTKDTGRASVERYRVLNLKPDDGPAFLTLTYPGEVFGYGFASTGMSLFRNSLYAGASSEGLPFHVFGLLSLCMTHVDAVRELVERHGVRSSGNALISDGQGQSIAVESTAGGTRVVERDGPIQAHANHVNAADLLPFEDYEAARKAVSQHRQRRIEALLQGECGRISPAFCMRCLADHDNHPGGICTHWNPPAQETTAAVVAEPTRGRLHVVRGAPCMNWPRAYSL